MQRKFMLRKNKIFTLEFEKLYKELLSNSIVRMAASEAVKRAKKAYYEKNKEKYQEYGRMKAREYYYNKGGKGSKEHKNATSKQRVYEEGTLRFIRRLFEK